MPYQPFGLDFPNMTICWALNVWERSFPNNLVSLAGHSSHYRWANGDPKRLGELLSSHTWCGISIQVRSFLSPTSFQLWHAASSPEGSGDISGSPQEICFTFLQRHRDSMETEWRGCVYSISSRPPPIPIRSCIFSWWVNPNVVSSSTLLNLRIAEKKGKPQNPLFNLIPSFDMWGDNFLFCFICLIEVNWPIKL